MNFEHRMKISNSLKCKKNFLGKKHSDKTKEKMSKSHLGVKILVGNYKNKKSEEHKKNLSLAWKRRKERFKPPMLGKHMSEEAKNKIRISKIGKKMSEELRTKLSESLKGNKSHFWKGGISFEPYSTDWTETLRRSIRERDKYVCQICGKPQGDIAQDIHHIDYDKKNCNPDNLITLCHKCHMKTNGNRKYWLKLLKTL